MKTKHSQVIVVVLFALAGCARVASELTPAGTPAPSPSLTARPAIASATTLPSRAATTSAPAPTRATVTPTLTVARPSSTPRPSRTPTPTALPTPTATQLPQAAVLVGPLVAFRVEEINVGNHLLILDAATGSVREMRNEFINYPFQIQWFGDGCRLYMGGRLFDLQGNELWRAPELDREHLITDNAWAVGLGWLSPDQEWLAYQVWSGFQGYEDAEFVDVAILHLDDPDTPVFLTSRGGAKRLAWSPDGRWLAYSTYDESGVLQLFRANPNGSIVEQLTRHDKPLDQIGYLAWSPDGQRIAYAVNTLYYESWPYEFRPEEQAWVGVLAIADRSLVRISPDHFGSVFDDSIWWSRDGSRIVFVGQGLPVSDERLSGNQIHWADATTGALVDSYYAEDAPSGWFGRALAVGDIDHMLVITEQGYFVMSAGDRTHQFLIDIQITDGWIRGFAAGPFDFPGETECQR